MSAALRPLPSRPNLEFEHKEAKALLRRLRAGDPESLARARSRHPEIDTSNVKLADAQLVIARDYGFTSWPKLVRWFGEADRHRYVRSFSKPERYESLVRGLLKEHRDRRIWTALLLTSLVPRFYGMRPADALDQAVSEADARLAIARNEGFPSWEVMLEESAQHHARHPHYDKKQIPDGEVRPMHLASLAMDTGNVEELQRIVESYPDLLTPTTWERKHGHVLFVAAFERERRLGVDAMRPVIAWLESKGLNVQMELNRQLCGHMRMETETVRWLLGRGADPTWVAPNGIPVLEYALIGYWNAEAADLVAERATPRKALWVAAGLGDVHGVRRFLDHDGSPTPAARKLRPDFNAVGPGGMPNHPDPDDDTILREAFLVAMLNGRSQVLEYMVSRGFQLNSLAWGQPMISLAVGNAWVEVVACLVQCGADLDLRGWRPNNTARELAREFFEDNPEDSGRRRIAELCGLDPDAILATEE